MSLLPKGRGGVPEMVKANSLYGTEFLLLLIIVQESVIA